jgi:hypothetical protein
MENLDNNAPQSEVVEPSALPQADTEVSEALALFGIEPTAPEADPEPATEEDPPTDQEPERKGITVKFNKEDVFIEDEKVAEYARKGLNYEKVEGRAKEYEAALDRAAKLNGYKDHAEYVANLDRLEQQAIQHKEDAFTELRQQMREEAENAGIDPERLDAWLDNNPLLQQAKEVMDRDKAAQETQKQQQSEEAMLKGWQNLFAKYPDLASAMSEEGQAAEWFTPAIQEKINRGYDPIDAYELANRDKISAEERKMAEQNVLKQQRLNKRAAVVTTGGEARDEVEVPKELADAFSLFGIDQKEAKKYVKK